ncbi:MAG: tRNA-intron lyase [Candidatus Thermoplasmatota archaeon]|nr:tRNA-intron lyase [Candidatus Thermoplasmatota archaeon]
MKLNMDKFGNEGEKEKHFIGKKLRVYDEETAQRLSSEGFGKMKKGKLDLELEEAAYLIEHRKLSGDLLHFLIRASEIEKGIEDRAVVYIELKKRGYRVKPGRIMKAVRGERSIRIRVFSERERFSFRSIINLLKRERSFIVCIVDEECDITAYKLSLFKPQNYGREIEDRMSAYLTGGRIFAENTIEQFGERFSNTYELSLYETYYLMKKGMLELYGCDDLLETAKKEQKDFELAYSVYEALMDKGYEPKTGFKYGTHFRVYDFRVDDIHAPYLVHSFKEGSRVAWNEISRASRVAHTVKKKMLFASVGSEINYIKCERFKV